MELRMYGFVAYNLSSIQKGIQFGHAVVEYNLMIDKMKGNLKLKDQFNKWREFYKTFIILDGGSTNLGKSGYVGSLNLLAEQIEQIVPIAKFYEPDLGDQLSAFVFICDERVFNKEKYPDIQNFEPFEKDWRDSINDLDLLKIESLREILKTKRLAI